jgi:uncharacterized protein (TIGR03790 family)
MHRLLCTFLALMAACTLVSCGRQSVVPGPPPPQAAGPQAELASALPGVNELAYPTQPARHISATSFELLDSAPINMSSSGVAYSPGQLQLNPFVASEGFAWAIFAVYGFPVDKSVYPLSYSLTASEACWVGYANYAHDHWQFTLTPDGDPVDYASGADLLSPAGVHYIAVIATEAPLTATSLVLTTSGDLADAPTAVLNVLSQTVAGMPADFSALGSSPGGAPFDTLTFDWGDSTEDTVITDPTQEVQHTFASMGNRMVKLTVANTNAQTAFVQQSVTIANPMRELLLVYNADIPEDLDLANYYASPRTGRAVDPAYILGIHPVAEVNPEEITRQNYIDTIREPIKAFIDASTFKSSLKYILLCKGVPYKIPGGNDASSVDSELCLLYSDDSYALDGWVWNGDYYWDMASGYASTPGSMYLKDTGSFSHGSFKATTVANVKMTLDYLVGRLTAYSYDNVKQLIDRAVNADTTGTGSIILDSSNSPFGGYDPPVMQNEFDTMVDPVWPWSADAAMKSGYELLHDAGFAVFSDVTPLTLTGVPTDNITVQIDTVLGYAGWGTNHAGGSFPNGGNYILKDLLFTYLPGACWISYESFNARTFTTGNINDPSHDGQGLIADFLYKGGTVAIGNAWEPYTIGCGDERWVFKRYIIGGDRWIEAAYKGLRLLSWMEVVVGDPLCRVK